MRRRKSSAILLLLGGVLPLSALGIACAAAPALNLAPAPAPQALTWLDEYRVQAHTRFQLKYLESDPDGFFNAGKKFKGMHVEAFTRSIKSGKEGAWWPSAVGVVAPQAKDRNLAKEILDDAHGAGEKIIAYHRMMEDDWAAKEHPDWVCKTVEGEPAKANRGFFMCLNSPYRDYYQTRGVELVKMGYDGFYFDEFHMPPEGCWCDYCKKKFKAETGLDAPDNRKPSNPLYEKYVDFENRSIDEAFRQWSKAFKSVNPGFAMIISASRWNSFGDRHLNDSLLENADSVKTEFNVGIRRGNNKIFERKKEIAPPDPEGRVALSWALARDVAHGRPPHVWIAHIGNEPAALAATGNMLAMGCIANLDVREEDLPDKNFISSFDLGNKVSPKMAGSKPKRWFGIYYSEDAEIKYSTNEVKRWQNVYYPVFGPFNAALEGHIPTAIVFDHDLKRNDMDGIKVLYIPSRENLSSESKAAIDRFKSGGGTVIEQTDSWQWWDADEQDGLKRKLINQLKDANPPERVEGASDAMAGFFDAKDGSTIVAVSPSAQWVAETKDDVPKLKDLTGMSVVLQRSPKSVTDLLSGQTMKVEKSGSGWKVAVPGFQNLALYRVEY